MSEYIYESNLNPGYDRAGNRLEEIVRCKDCRRFDAERSYCNFIEDEVWFGGFCAWAVKQKKSDE